MSVLKTTLAAAALAAGTLTIAAPAYADISTFASFSASSSDSNVRWEKIGTAGGSIYSIATAGSNVQGAAAVNFNFLQPAFAAFGPLHAAFTLSGSATASPATTSSSFIFQPILVGSFSFVYTGAAPLVLNNTTYITGANLLSATFTIGTIAGQRNGTSGSLSSSTEAAGTISYSSDFLDFSGATSEDFALNLSSIVGGLKQVSTSASLNSFKANAGGSFSTDPAPIVTAVPEPAVWGLLLVGFALVGSAMRRRTLVALS